jgi:hypothetical protein
VYHEAMPFARRNFLLFFKNSSFLALQYQPLFLIIEHIVGALERAANDSCGQNAGIG